ncbi:MAG: hypothetical protein K9N47_20065 [Prosthecobacter sp.]|uniref:hypothetical protein n=1 Tax=Prosthecobacter sp. TaxID=1965333 RepID=UPI0025FFB13F|nr:hypothetical protein [Prosthecobacter sp.]MCF7788427.1 hypothetical protein [Prosthecobacter sp.]
MTEKVCCIFLGFVWLACSTLRGQDLSETLSNIASGEGRPEVMSKALMPWLDEAGFDRLKESLDATEQEKQRSAPEWLAVACVEEHLQRPTQSLAAWKKACADSQNVTVLMQLGLAHALAHQRQFGEAVKVLEEMDVANADTHCVQEAVWLLHSMAAEGGQQAALLTLSQRMAAQRPDDAELKLLLARLPQARGFSPETTHSAKEALSQAKDAPTKLAWRLVVLDSEMRQEKNLEAAEEALQGLAESRPNSEAEWQLLGRLTRALQQGRRNPSKAGMPKEEGVAEQFKDRPAVVRRMAICLRAVGATDTAQKVLGLLKEDAGAKKLISDWEEEDWRETQPTERARMAAVSKVEDSGKQAVAPAWHAEVKKLDPEDRLKKLLEVWKADPRDQAAALQLIERFYSYDSKWKKAEMQQVILRTHFACADSTTRQAWWRQLDLREIPTGLRMASISAVASHWWLSMRWRMGEKVGYWEALAQSQNDYSLPSLLEMARLAPENEGTKFHLARALWRTGAVEDTLHLMDGMTTPHWRAAARLETAVIDLSKGRLHAATRTMFAMAGDEALDADMAATLSTGLMAWREWVDAVEFLAAQRRRFPADYRLAALHGLALRGAGEPTKAAEVFLEMGGFEQEIGPVREYAQFEEERGMRSDPSDDVGRDAQEKWMQVQQAVSTVLREDLGLEPWINQQKQRKIGYFGMMYGDRLTPPRVQYAAAWGMAHLFILLAELPEAQRQGWVEKARTAKLPMPELLVAGKMIHEQGNEARLTLDPAWLEQHLDVPWVGTLWLQMATTREPLGPVGVELALKASRVNLEAHVPTALKAALLAWRLAPQDPAALDAVAAALARGKPEDAAALITQMGTDLGQIPLEVRRRAAPQLIKVLNSLSQKVTDKTRLERMHREMLQSAMWLGEWEIAAREADAALASRSAAHIWEDPFPAKRWVESMLASPFVLRAFPNRFSGELVEYLRMHSSEEKVELIKAEEKSAFLAAGAKIQNWLFKLQWQLAGGDEVGAKKMVPVWLQAEPENGDAMLEAAGLAIEGHDLPRALDLLHARMQGQKKSEERRLAQIVYLLAGTYQGERREGMNTKPPTPPPAVHEKRLRAVAAELLPRLQKIPDGQRAPWAEILRGLGMQSEADTLRDKPKKKAELQERLWNGESTAYFNNLTRSLNEAHELTFSDDVLWVVEYRQATPTAATVEVMVRLLRNEADRRFYDKNGYSGQLKRWQRIIGPKGLAKSVLAAAEPGKDPTWRRLVQAVQAAEACEEWEQAIAWAAEALKLDAGNPTLKAVIAGARLRSPSGDAENLVEALKAQPPAEAYRNLFTMLKTAEATTDCNQRLKLAAAVVRLARQQPNLMSPKEGSRGGAVSTTFALLADAVKDGARGIVAPELYPEVNPFQNSFRKPQTVANPASADAMAARKKLFVEFCELSLKHPTWIDETLHPLLVRYVVDQQPDEVVLVDYIKQGLAEPSQQTFDYINELNNLEWQVQDGGKRMRLARLGLQMLDTVYGNSSPPHSFGPNEDGLIKLIAGAIPPGRDDHHLWALWECPLDLKDRYTAEQLALNHERRELMDQLWQASKTVPQLRRQLFPTWAAYRLHFVDKMDEVLAVARELAGDAPNYFSLLREFVLKAVESYENPHHVLAAELVEALLRDKSSDLKSEAVKEIVSSMIRVLTEGRDHQTVSMPPLSATPEAVEKLLSLDLQARRREVLSRLEELMR